MVQSHPSPAVHEPVVRPGHMGRARPTPRPTRPPPHPYTHRHTHMHTHMHMGAPKGLAASPDNAHGESRWQHARVPDRHHRPGGVGNVVGPVRKRHEARGDNVERAEPRLQRRVESAGTGRHVRARAQKRARGGAVKARQTTDPTHTCTHTTRQRGQRGTHARQCRGEQRRRRTCHGRGVHPLRRRDGHVRVRLRHGALGLGDH